MCVGRGEQGRPSKSLLLSPPFFPIPLPTLKQSPPPTLPASPLASTLPSFPAFPCPHFLPHPISSHFLHSLFSLKPSTPSCSLRPISPTHPPLLPRFLPSSSTCGGRHVPSSAHASFAGNPGDVTTRSALLPALSRKDAKVVTCPERQRGCAQGA